MRRINGSKNNNGSATVEIMLVMPIIIFIIFNIIFLFLDSMNDGIIRGEIYTALYTYEENSDMAVVQNGLEVDIQSIIIGSEIPSLKTYKEKSKIGLELQGQSGGEGGGYRYTSEPIKYSVEYGICTSRLRRWQLYGDIFWE